MADKFTELLSDTSSYPYIYLFGTDGNGGLWKTRNVPVKYSDCRLNNLPTQEANPTGYATVEKYCSDSVNFIHEKRVGLFFYSRPSQENRFGTGTGKTQSAITILNEYLIERVKLHVTGQRVITDNPVYFCKSTDLQTTFNSQFRGTYQMQETASKKYYAVKDRIKSVDLLVFDDVATKATTEAFTEELYEIIDYRATEELATIFTSNVPLSEIADLLGDRIASRIEGMTVPVEFKGKDFRKKVL